MEWPDKCSTCGSTVLEELKETNDYNIECPKCEQMIFRQEARDDE